MAEAGKAKHVRLFQKHVRLLSETRTPFYRSFNWCKTGRGRPGNSLSD